MEHEILGVCMGVRIEKRGDGPKDKHLVFTMLSEDDGHWGEVGSGASTLWLDENIKVLQQARRWLKKNAKKTDWGYNVSNTNVRNKEEDE